MITYVDGSIFLSPAQTLVNTVNTAGVMGKGLAKAFKAIYPEMFTEYASWCQRGELETGRLLLYRTAHKWVLNFPTKRHWRQRSRLEDIAAGLETFRQSFTEQGITSIAFPQLGCGNGGLDWETQVRPLMERELGPLPIDVYVHISPSGAAAMRDLEREVVAEWLRGEPPALSFATFWADLARLFGAGHPAPGRPNGSPPASVLAIPGREAPVARDDLFALWRRLRTFGYLTPEDVELALGVPAQPILDVLGTLPYVARARVAPLPPNAGYDALSTQAILGAPGAHGIQLVAAWCEERPTPRLQHGEDEAAWHASLTTRQLALFSTS